MGCSSCGKKRKIMRQLMAEQKKKDAAAKANQAKGENQVVTPTRAEARKARSIARAERIRIRNERARRRREREEDLNQRSSDQ